MRESVCMREKRAIRKVDFKLYENLHNLQIGPIKITFLQVDIEKLLIGLQCA